MTFMQVIDFSFSRNSLYVSWISSLIFRQVLDKHCWEEAWGCPSIKKVPPKVLPVLRGVCEGRHDVLLYKEEHWQEEPQPHGAHHWPDGEGLDWGQHEQALRWVVVKFGHWKEERNDVRRHLLVQPTRRNQVSNVLPTPWTNATNQA